MVVFHFSGHKNILGTHKNTLEFTKESNLSLNGDCIIGVDADFDLTDVKRIFGYSKIKIIITVDDLVEEVICEVNKDFNDKHEIVIRKTNFVSERTLGINADKAAIDLNRELIKKLKNPNKRGRVEIHYEKST